LLLRIRVFEASGGFDKIGSLESREQQERLTMEGRGPNHKRAKGGQGCAQGWMGQRRREGMKKGRLFCDGASLFALARDPPLCPLEGETAHQVQVVVILSDTRIESGVAYRRLQHCFPQT